MKFSDWEIGSFDRDTAVDFCKKGISPLSSVFLVSRGVTDIDDARTILGLNPAEISDPFLMADMGKAVSLIASAVENGEKIAIYGDYDVDGMTSCALLALWLRSKGALLEVYIPGRSGEGYGLNTVALDVLKNNGVGLVVTVDCGITAIDEAQYARSLGLKLVITDHHKCKVSQGFIEELPEADAVVNPKRPDCRYPDKSLAGVGVVFKLICALEKDMDPGALFRQYGDLVAIGTVADLMPVTGENRELIRRGLAVINDNPRPGVRSLLRESYPERSKVTSSTISFTIAPRLNAAGRMGQPELSVDLLLTGDAAEADKLAAELYRLNAERRSLEAAICNEALEMLPEPGPDGPIVLSKRGWHQGVTGIVAAKLSERFMTPTIILSIDENGTCRGSCRSYGDFGIFDALRSCEDLLENYGGHEMAAGVTIAEGNLDALRSRITGYYRNNLAVGSKPGLRLDFEVEKPSLLTVGNVGALKHLEPFGNGYPPPCLCIRDALITSAHPIGAGQHMRLKVEKSGVSLDCVFFSMTPAKLGADAGEIVDLAFEPQINEFRGRVNVQLHLLDVRPAGR